MNSSKGDADFAGGTPERQKAMGVLARATRAELEAAWSGLPEKPEVFPVRGPETGLVMVRGRIGGGGAPFNLGEATVSRASVRLADGTVGHGQALGTDLEKVRLAAVFDALLQVSSSSLCVRQVVASVEERIAAEQARRQRQTAATRVDFFTMVRGDD
ncbi:phosphonate C-P lyase system protein PhnG [Sinorhizobium sp. BG8]|uniref:phosphonate C-P lyase system protein PhnG n=1 Tax=Sinorhizobium sp. BG8 TaxID=2613773 RepID=UPI00193E6F35|nr:phosphonate C-P lyase system protein PhnG [Sinorhizobium sp. BG8]QRM54321.1 phosphonate C-P lyase system protein PhnG [Sinorhizobium sp. BG8]